MGWAVGFDSDWQRDIGYGVPAICDHPDCSERIDRGLAFVCAGEEPYGGEDGCGLYFCGKHLAHYREDDGWTSAQCERCADGAEPFDAKPDVKEWTDHKMTCPTWQQWRDENPDAVKALQGV